MVIGKPHRVFLIVIDGLCVLVKHLKKGVGKRVFPEAGMPSMRRCGVYASFPFPKLSETTLCSLADTDKVFAY